MSDLDLDAMPIGAVLRASNGLIWVKRYTNGWRREGVAGSLATHLLVSAHSPLVELVEKPATLPMLRDGDNEVWLPLYEGYYCRESDVLSRSEVERNVGAVTEEAS